MARYGGSTTVLTAEIGWWLCRNPTEFNWICKYVSPSTRLPPTRHYYTFLYVLFMRLSITLMPYIFPPLSCRARTFQRLGYRHILAGSKLSLQPSLKPNSGVSGCQPPSFRFCFAFVYRRDYFLYICYVWVVVCSCRGSIFMWWCSYPARNIHQPFHI